MTLYNPQYHTDGSPVVVTPEEVGLMTIREEIGNAAWLAVPGKSALVNVLACEFMCSVELSMIWPLRLTLVCLCLIVFASHMF